MMKPLIDGFFTDTTNLRIKFLFHAETLYSSSILKFCYAFTTSKYLIYNGKNFFSKKTTTFKLGLRTVGLFTKTGLENAKLEMY